MKFNKILDNPLVLLDNVPVKDIESILLIDPINLKSLDVYRSIYHLGDHSIQGIISIKTKTDNFAGLTWKDQTAFLTYKALQRPCTFYQPIYDKLEEINDPKPDFRTLLYWNPDVKTRNLENKTIVFLLLTIYQNMK